MRRSRPALLLLALACVACSAPSRAQREVLQPPYRTDESGALVVREDLVPLLELGEARSEGAEAVLEGFGKAAFAPDASYAVRSPFDAYVEMVHVVPGDRVQAGDPLATLRSPEVARMRADARRLAALRTADRDALERTERLVSQGAASTREVVELRGRLAAYDSELRGIRQALATVGEAVGGADRVVLRATAPGEVLSRTVAPGERVDAEADRPAFVIGDATRLVVYASFPERDAPLLRAEGACRFQVPALGDRWFSGTVRRVTHAVDAGTRAARVVCAPEEPEPSLRAEMAVRVEAEVRGEGTVTVERGALLMRRDDYVVFVEREPGRLERRVVRPGAVIGDHVQIVEGVEAGERVVVRHAVLLDGELNRLL